MFSTKDTVKVYRATGEHVKYAEEICELVYVSAQERGTGIAKRSPDYIKEKMLAGKAIVALDGDKIAGFAYIETWEQKQFVANSGLIVAHAYRKSGVARRIKRKIFKLSRKLFPEAKIFSITTGHAVMKINYELGFRPVTFSELTSDKDFWDGCQGCCNYDILERNNRKMCLCTALLFDPRYKPKRIIRFTRIGTRIKVINNKTKDSNLLQNLVTRNLKTQWKKLF
ncbi:N-acetyltransferase [Bacteroidia bacterium]|nr:N-acetyltransferase [Bacteroidia bacterium]